MVGVVSLVMLSALLAPESEPLASTGVPEAPGAVLSIVTVRLLDAAPTLPAVSVTLAVRVWVPSASALVVTDQLPELSAVAVPSTVVPFVSYSVTVLPGSAPAPLTVGVLLLVMLSVLLVPLSELANTSRPVGALGAVVSIVTESEEDAPLSLPAASLALTVSVWLPPASVLAVMVQLPEPSAVVVPRTVVPSVS